MVTRIETDFTDVLGDVTVTTRLPVPVTPVVVEKAAEKSAPPIVASQPIKPGVSWVNVAPVFPLGANDIATVVPAAIELPLRSCTLKTSVPVLPAEMVKPLAAFPP